MIESLTKQLSTTKNSIVRDATMLDGGRMALPAGLLACATALGLFVEAGFHSAQAHVSVVPAEAAAAALSAGPPWICVSAWSGTRVCAGGRAVAGDGGLRGEVGGGVSET